MAVSGQVTNARAMNAGIPSRSKSTLPLPIKVRLGVSRLGLLFAGALHLATAALWLLLPLPQAFVAIGLLIITVDFIVWQLALLRRLPRSAIAIEVRIDRTITVTRRNGVVEQGAIGDGSYVGWRLTSLCWRRPEDLYSRSLMILPDMLPADDFRRLRTVLRLSYRAITKVEGELNAGA